MKKIVYVTGCLGFIGMHVTRQCLERGWHVIGVDKGTYASNFDFLHLNSYTKISTILIDCMTAII